MLVDVLAVLGALAVAVAVGAPGVRRRAGACMTCGRVLVLGERTCDCAD